MSTFGVTAVVLFAIPLALGLISLRRAAPDRLARGRLPATRPALVLALPGGGGDRVRQLSLPAVRGRARGASAALRERLPRTPRGVDTWIVGTALAILGFVCFAVNLVVTLHNMRAPGMAWRRVPLFSWAAGISGYLLLVIGPGDARRADHAVHRPPLRRRASSTPARAGRRSSTSTSPGSSSRAPTCSCWSFAGGVISDVLPTFARKPLFSHRGGDALPAGDRRARTRSPGCRTCTRPRSRFSFEIFAMLFALALTVPIGLLIFNWIATLWGGTLHIRAAPLFAIGAISALTIGLAVELACSVHRRSAGSSTTRPPPRATTIAVLRGRVVLGGFAGASLLVPEAHRADHGRGPRARSSFSAITRSASTSTC